jgi:hypothetical protein
VAVVGRDFNDEALVYEVGSRGREVRSTDLKEEG